jgi:hypothetical protein
MRYEFTNLQTGMPCCKSDNIKLLCDRCVQQAIGTAAHAAPTVAASRPAPKPTPAQVQAQIDAGMALMTANAAARAAAAAAPPIVEAPEPPSLVAAIHARRSGQTYNLDAPVFGGGVKPYPVTAAAVYGNIDEPPSLVDAIRNRRNQR